MLVLALGVLVSKVQEHFVELSLLLCELDFVLGSEFLDLVAKFDILFLF